MSVHPAIYDATIMCLDIDVNGGLRVKQALGEEALSIFIEPPTIETLRQRLESRGTDSIESIDARVDRARYEIDQAPMRSISLFRVP